VSLHSLQLLQSGYAIINLRYGVILLVSVNNLNVVLLLIINYLYYNFILPTPPG